MGFHWVLWFSVTVQKHPSEVYWRNEIIHEYARYDLVFCSECKKRINHEVQITINKPVYCSSAHKDGCVRTGIQDKIHAKTPNWILPGWDNKLQPYQSLVGEIEYQGPRQERRRLLSHIVIQVNGLL